MRGFVFASVYYADRDMDPAHVTRNLKEKWDVNTTHEKVESLMEALCKDGELIRTPRGNYKPSGSAKKAFEKKIDAMKTAEDDAREYFESLVKQSKALKESKPLLDPSKVWEIFESQFLRPMVRDIGANTYELITGSSPVPDSAHAGRFLKQFASHYRDALKEIITDFLSPNQNRARDYIVRLVHASFCIEASGVSEDVLDKLDDVVSRQTQLRLFIDTNFLFSLLDLRDNPLDSATAELKRILSTLESPRISLLITSKTIDEAKRVIAATKEQLSRIPMTQNFSGAISQLPMSGFAKRFFAEKRKRQGNLSPEVWFRPYLSDFTVMAKGKGIEISSEKLDQYGTRQDVVDDIADTREYQEKHVAEDRRKNYEKIDHDVILWHLVNDKRGAYVESPLDATDWVLTLDFWLIGFDRRKQKSKGSRTPICLHPTSFIQLLQFWIPRSEQFEQAILGGVRLPFIFKEFDPEDERITEKIMEQAGLMENGETFSQETLVQAAMNRGLRSRIGIGPIEEEEKQLIQQALVDAKQEEAQKIDTLRDELAVAKTDLETEKEKSREQLAKLANTNSWWQYGVFLATSAIASATVAWLIGFSHLGFNAFASRVNELATCFAVFGIFHWIWEFVAKKWRPIQNTQNLWLFKKIASKKVWTILGGIAVAFTINVAARYYGLSLS